jgi:hypothetical protein
MQKVSRIPLSRLEKAAWVDRRSSLFVYMIEHHADLSGVLMRAGRPNWKALSKEFAAAGLTDINGNPPTDAVSRNTWVKVRALVAKEGVPTKRRERPSAVVATPGAGGPTQLPPGPATGLPGATTPPRSDRTRPAFTFPTRTTLKPRKDDE